MSRPVTFAALEMRLAALVGAPLAGDLLDDARLKTGIKQLESFEHQRLIADQLIRHGGFPGILGRTLKMEALAARRESSRKNSAAS